MDGGRTLRSGREGMVQSGGTWHDLLDLRAAGEPHGHARHRHSISTARRPIRPLLALSMLD